MSEVDVWVRTLERLLEIAEGDRYVMVSRGLLSAVIRELKKRLKP